MKPDHVRDSDQDGGGGVGSGDRVGSAGSDVRAGSDDQHGNHERADSADRAAGDAHVGGRGREGSDARAGRASSDACGGSDDHHGAHDRVGVGSDHDRAGSEACDGSDDRVGSDGRGGGVGGDAHAGSDDPHAHAAGDAHHDHHDRARSDAHPRPHRHPHRTPDPTPPPPGGILWTIAGDIRALLMLPSALTMQVAHPAVGAGVDEYSVFRTDPWGRGERSVRSVLLWVYGGDEAAAEGRRLRALHRSIQGTDTRGHRYHALMPAAYAWVHATGFPVYRHAQRYLGRPFTEAEERQLYAEWLQVGRVLGIHDRDMPRTPEEFWPYYRKVLAEELELTPVARELTATDASVPPPDRGPRPVRALLRAVWPLLLPPLARFRRFLTIGLMPPDARQALGLPWTPRQERALRRFGRVVRTLVPLLPERLRYLPFARRARARHRAARH